MVLVEGNKQQNNPKKKKAQFTTNGTEERTVLKTESWSLEADNDGIDGKERVCFLGIRIIDTIQQQYKDPLTS